MSTCVLLKGENIAPKNAKEARALIGKRVKFLRDIDSFVRTGIIEEAYGREIRIGGDWFKVRGIIEMVAE